MIPTVILPGVVLRRWWWLGLGEAAIGWPLLLLAADVVGFNAGLFATAALAVAKPPSAC